MHTVCNTYFSYEGEVLLFWDRRKQKNSVMETEKLMSHIEALIFAAEKPVTKMEVTMFLNQSLEEEMDEEQISLCVEAVKEKYSATFYPFELKETGGGYLFLTKQQYHKTVMQLNGDKHIKKLSTAAMETLAIIAYKQPVTKAEIEFIRGVSADYSIQKLLEKELIVITGRNEEMIGKPLIYATSKNFMDYLGINNPNDLPKLKEISNIEVVVPTPGAEAEPVNNSNFIVAADGELIET